MSATITLIPIGPVPAELLPWLQERLEEVLGWSVVVGEEVSLPATGYDHRRRQYRGDDLIATLRALPCPASERVLGLTDVDCYASGLNFIFGQATLDGREAFVALPRLRQSFYGLPEKPALFRWRTLKEAVHELGHTWGLSHCPDPHCVMYFSNTLQDTDVKGADFCSECWGELEKTGKVER